MPLKQKICQLMFPPKTWCSPGQYPRGYPWEVLGAPPVPFRIYSEDIPVYSDFMNVRYIDIRTLY